MQASAPNRRRAARRRAPGPRRGPSNPTPPRIPRRFARRARRVEPGPLSTLRPVIEAPVDVLVLCTANVCRSPMAEAILRRRLEERGVPARVHSAGRLRGGKPTTVDGFEAMQRLGYDIAAHRSTRVTPAMIEGADLVLGMARDHVVHAVELVPDALPRTFTLKELTRRGSTVGPRPPGEPLAKWLARVHATRGPTDLLRAEPADDVPDPIGLPAVRYRAVAAEIDEQLARLVDLIWR